MHRALHRAVHHTRWATEKSNSWIKKGEGIKGIKRKEEGGSLETQKPPRNFEGDVRAGEKEEERLPGAGGGEGDNCRRASLLRCSCKEVLRRDKAAAITIEPRGNSLPTCYTHTHTRVYVARSRTMRDASDLGAHIFFSRVLHTRMYTRARTCVCEKIRGCTSDMRRIKKKRKKKINAMPRCVSGKIYATIPEHFVLSLARWILSHARIPFPRNILLNKVCSKHGDIVHRRYIEF